MTTAFYGYHQEFLQKRKPRKLLRLGKFDRNMEGAEEGKLRMGKTNLLLCFIETELFCFCSLSIAAQVAMVVTWQHQEHYGIRYMHGCPHELLVKSFRFWSWMKFINVSSQEPRTPTKIGCLRDNDVKTISTAGNNEDCKLLPCLRARVPT